MLRRWLDFSSLKNRRLLSLIRLEEIAANDAIILSNKKARFLWLFYYLKYALLNWLTRTINLNLGC
jgi:hypothetical protein